MIDKTSASPTAIDADLDVADRALFYAILAFASGAPYRDVEAARFEVRRLKDLQLGLHRAATRLEHEKLSAEIERRQAEHAALGERVVNLGRAANAAADRCRVDPEGTGEQFRSAQRAQREAANTAFAEYEAANLKHIALGKQLAELVTQRDALERDDADDAFSF